MTRTSVHNPLTQKYTLIQYRHMFKHCSNDDDSFICQNLAMKYYYNYLEIILLYLYPAGQKLWPFQSCPAHYQEHNFKKECHLNYNSLCHSKLIYITFSSPFWRDILLTFIQPAGNECQLSWKLIWPTNTDPLKLSTLVVAVAAVIK